MAQYLLEFAFSAKMFGKYITPDLGGRAAG
jgi:hypothetical protein